MLDVDMKRIALLLVVLSSLLGASPKPNEVKEAEVRKALYPLEKADPERVRALGTGALPHLVSFYSSSSPEDRTVIAWVFYELGWKSSAAKTVLLTDVHTPNEKLRLQVQWALGRVSDDSDVMLVLADIMRNDDNALFRDKAACALAYDQIHLNDAQKAKLYAKLIDGLTDAKPQVRTISLQALQIHTGQTKGFSAGSDAVSRAKAVSAWRAWLEEYRRNL